MLRFAAFLRGAGHSGVIAVPSLLAMLCSPALAQTSATVHGPEFVKAGETLNLAITVDRAPNFTGSSLQLTLGPDSGGGAFGYGIELQPNKTEYSLQVRIPEAAIGGTWSVADVRFASGMPGSYPTLSFTKYSFLVIPKRDLVYPTSADVGMKPSQAQLLRTEAVHLQAQIQDLKGQILEYKSSNKLTVLLRQNIEKAVQSLDETEHEFRSLDSASKQQENSQVFFDDLRTSYREASHDLKAQGLERHGPELLLVAIPQAKTETVIYPVVAQAVLRAFEQNELAYDIAADAQMLTFDLVVSSIPAGATVSYRRRGDEFKRATAPTNSTIKALPFAIWIIRFEKDGFRTIEREHDPFREPNHVVNVELPQAK
jgi:hypothetical protein